MTEAYTPFYAKFPNVVIRTWTEDFEDHLGNKAVLTKVEFRDKKNKLHEVVAQVKWTHINEPPVYKK